MTRRQSNNQWSGGIAAQPTPKNSECKHPLEDEQCISTPGHSNVKSSSISKSILQIYYQNIQGIKWKSDEILNFFYPVLPHVVCFTQHHLNHHETVQFHTGSYTLGANYCRHSLKKGGVCVLGLEVLIWKNFLMIRA